MARNKISTPKIHTKDKNVSCRKNEILLPKPFYCHLIQITVATNKDPLSQSGVTAVVTALQNLYQRMADASTGADADAWRAKSPIPEVLYLVPLEMLVSFRQG